MKDNLVKIIDDDCNNCNMSRKKCNCYNEIMQDKHYEEQQEIFYYLNR